MKTRSAIKICVFMLVGFSVTFARAQSISGVINSYYHVTAINTVTNTLTLNTTAGLSPGAKILVMQMKGATINFTNTASFGDISAIGNAGNYETNFICSISGNDVLLEYQLVRSYTVSDLVQVVTIPRYNSVTITDTLQCSAWNAATGTGGIIILEATDTIFLNSPIDASGQGFTGGALFNYTTPTYDCSWFYDVTDYAMTSAPSGSPDYLTGSKKGEGIADYVTNLDYGRGKQANGGGGGNNHNTGGAGGANYGAGGNGGQRSNEGAFFCHGLNPGVGGLSVSAYGYTVGNNRIFMGGGGGAGHENNSRSLPGGNGGGIVILIADVIASSGQKIMANGSVPINPLCNDPFQAEGDGGGGGGAGGAVALVLNQVSGSIVVEAKGANGSNSSYHAGPGFVNDCTGPGGGGGGGAVWLSTGSIPGAVTPVVTGGANGVVSTFSAIVACRGLANSATSGGGGSTLLNYAVPQSSPFVCAPLAVPALNYFKGRIVGNVSHLFWQMNDTSGISGYVVERSQNQVRYESVAERRNDGSMNFTADDRPGAGVFFYRLRITHTNGTVDYSTVVSLNTIGDSLIRWATVQPVTANGHLSMRLFANRATDLRASVYDASGRKHLAYQVRLTPGYNNCSLPMQSAGAGIYVLVLQAAEETKVIKFIDPGQ